MQLCKYSIFDFAILQVCKRKLFNRVIGNYAIINHGKTLELFSTGILLSIHTATVVDLKRGVHQHFIFS